MLRRLLTLISLYSLIIFAVAVPTLAVKTSGDEDGKPSSKEKKKSSCAVCGANAPGNTLADRIDGLATVGRTSQMRPFAPIHRSIFEGVPVNFVSSASGNLGFAVSDLSLPGSMPAIFQRVYASERSKEDRGLGDGWSFVFDDRITFDGDSAILTSGEGPVIAFRADGQNGHFILQTPEALVHQSFDLNLDAITEQAAGLTRTYKKMGDSYRLIRIADSNDNSLNIGFDERGNLSRIAGSGGTITLEWSKNKNARLMTISDSAGRRVSFKQSGHRLQGITDSAGHEWGYDYYDGRLTRAMDPLGRVLLQVGYDRSGRVVKSGDGAGVNLYNYDSTSSSLSQRTVITDPVGVKTVFKHTRSGAIAAVSEDGGQTLLQVAYNTANRPTHMSSAPGNEAELTFDEKDRMTQSVSTDGLSKTYAYDELGRISSQTESGVRTDYTRDARGRITVAKSGDSAQSYRAAYDARGRMIRMETDTGSNISNDYDAAGNITAFTTVKGERFQKEFDAAGRVTTERFPSGRSFSYERDARGIVTKKSDNQGRSMTIERDDSGQVIGFVAANGGWLRATHDQAGRIVSLTTSAGQVRNYAYDGRGALTDFTNSRGQHKRFGYDVHGRVKSITGDDGSKTIIERDQNGHIQLISAFKGGGLRYDYDAKGQLVATNATKNQGPFINAAYSAPSLDALAPQGMDCLFGNDWFSGDTFGSLFGFDSYGFEFGCGTGFGYGGGGGGGGGCDPFSGFDPFGSGFGFDPFGCSSFGGETHEECVARHRAACDLQFYACLGLTVSGGIVVFATCDLATLILGTPACAVLTGVVGVVGAAACVLRGTACNWNAADGCPP
jgi:YD repeat-containing protein